MSTELNRINTRKHSRERLKKLVTNAENVVIVHYSCESFFNTKNGRSPRITSIATRNLSSAQSKSFSIHQMAEIERLDNSLIDSNYENLEKKLLHGFFEYMKTHQGVTWVHWNMRNINYGFAALEHRYKVLGGDPFILEDGKKIDVARIMSSVYGRGYAKNPKLVDLTALNKFDKTYLLSGAEEAHSFEKGEYLKLHQSTLAKVDIIAYIIELAASGGLKTRASLWQIYGVHPKVVVELVKEHWFFGIASIVAVGYAILRMFGIAP